jgi:cell volume regulation protein A
MVALVVVADLAGGAVVGMGIGWLGARLLRWAATASGLLSIGVVAVAVLAYAVAAALHVSGFLATYICALVLGNARLPHRSAVLGFATGVGWLAQIGLFVLLGLLASPSRLPAQVLPALAIGLVLLLVARPLSVVVSTSPFGLRWREQAFLSWSGLRGAVPIVLATVPITLHSPDGVMVFDLVLVLVIAFTLVQAPTLPWVARTFGVTEALHSQDLGLEVVALEEVGAEVLQVAIGAGSRLAGVDVVELRLPKDTKVALLVRGDTRIVPRGMTRLRVADQLLIVTTASSRAAVEARLSALSEKGRLAGWI